MIARTVRVRWVSFEFATLTLAAFSFYPIHETIYFGQIMIVLLALWSLSVLAYQEGHIVLSACALAFATGLKVTPILAVSLFVLWNDRKWLLSYLAAGTGIFAALAAINGTETLRAWVHILPSMSGLEPAAVNKNISSVLSWIYYGRLFDQDSMLMVISAPPPMLMIAAKVACAVFLLGCLYPVWRNRMRMGRDERGIAMAVIALATITVSPVSWRHAYALASLPLALVWARTLRQSAPVWQSLLLALTTVSLGTPIFDRAAAMTVSPFAQVFFASVWVMSSVAFCLTTLWSPAFVWDPAFRKSPLIPRLFEPDSRLLIQK
jgi:hypothetical protein